MWNMQGTYLVYPKSWNHPPYLLKIFLKYVNLNVYFLTVLLLCIVDVASRKMINVKIEHKNFNENEENANVPL